MLDQWLDAWTTVMAATVGGGRAQRVHNDGGSGRSREDGTGLMDGRSESTDRQSDAPPRTTEHSPRDAGAGVAETGPTRVGETEEEQILHRAYLKWLGEGCPDGQHLRHYYEALHEVRD